jgi:hypothetical protein
VIAVEVVMGSLSRSDGTTLGISTHGHACPATRNIVNNGTFLATEVDAGRGAIRSSTIRRRQTKPHIR